MIDHISFSVKNFEHSRDFYDQTLSLLGYERLMNFNDQEHQVAGYGKNGKPSFWIGSSKKSLHIEEYIGKSAGFHVAFVASTTESIHQWYESCIKLGGQDNGRPGPRPEYHPGYYAAFIIDPNGWRIEACFQNYQGS